MTTSTCLPRRSNDCSTSTPRREKSRATGKCKRRPERPTHLQRLLQLLSRGKRDETREPVNGKHCLVWTGALNSDGYPIAKVDGRCVLVTRFELKMLVRSFRPKEQACHECHYPPCIEPAHLQHGTQSRNMRQMWARKRRTRPATFLEEGT